MRTILAFVLSRLCLFVVALPFFVGSSAQAQTALGNALTFNGTQYVTVSNFGAIIPTTEITVEFWADTAGYAGQSAFMLSPDQSTNRLNAHVDYGSSSPGTTYWDFGNITTSGRVSAISPPNSIGNWVHYALVASQSGDYMRIYTNGVLQISQATMTPFVRGNYNLQIGGPGFPYNGTLDELRVWSVARTQTQIQSDLYTPLMGNEANLVVYYKFDSASGNIVTNSAIATGSAYNGVLTGTPAWVSSSIPVPINPVTSLNDSGRGSLRYAVANLAAGSTITFAGALSGQTILLTNGQVELSNNITIDASALANGVQINGNGNGRIFQVDSGKSVVLNALTLTNGNSHGSDSQDDNGGDGMGGGVYNLGTLAVSNCTFANNTAGGGNAAFNSGGNGYGGAIYNAGTLTVNRCTLAGNFGTGGSGDPNGGSGFGAGIYNASTLVMNNSTLAGNNASGGSPADGFANGGNGLGGAIYNVSTTVLNDDTIANNTANDGPGSALGSGGNSSGGGVNTSVTVNMTNTIVCGNMADSGANISGSYSSANNLVDANALLAPLGFYGGPTQTMPPEPGSPAINAGRTTPLTVDQRGLTRPVGTPDIGSVEIQSGEAFTIVLNTTDNGAGSLRQTIANAPNDAYISFAPSLSGQTIVLTSGQIVLTNTIFIVGTNLPSGITISGNGTSRLFEVTSTSLAVLEFLNLTNGNPGSGNNGGAILNFGLLEAAACTMAGNTSAQGGAIENAGTTLLICCTLTGNHSVNNGGAIDNNQGPLQLLQCTLYGNSSGQNGGGLANYLNTLALTNSIVAGNTGDGGDIYNFASSTVAAGGSNLVQVYANFGTLNGAGTLINKAPMLAALGNYGGNVPTMPPLPGSPAIDGGVTSADSVNADERDYPRVSGERVDIGAVEVQIASALFPFTENLLGDGSMQFSLTNIPGGSFSILATTNLALPLSAWSDLGTAAESPLGSGQFQFSDPQATNHYPQRFYRLRSP